MSNQTKIIIGILAVVVLFGGFLLWKNYQPAGNILIQTDKTEYQPGDTLKVKIKNNIGKNISFSSCYPYYLERKNEKWESYKYTECHELNGNGHYIAPKQEKTFEIILPETLDGLHRLAIPVCIDCKNNDFFRDDKRFYSNEFTIKKEVTGWSLPSNKYIFLDQHAQIDGKIIEGGGTCAGPLIDFLNHSFNKETKVVSGMINFEATNEKLKVVFGSGLSLSGGAGGGISTELTGIYEIPYKNSKIEINKVDSEGTIYFLYKGKEITLKSGEEWKEVKTEIIRRESCERKDTITDRIINYGILDKDKIQSW